MQSIFIGISLVELAGRIRSCPWLNLGDTTAWHVLVCAQRLALAADGGRSDVEGMAFPHVERGQYQLAKGILGRSWPYGASDIVIPFSPHLLIAFLPPLKIALDRC
jgi:hypothetical protein